MASKNLYVIGICLATLLFMGCAPKVYFKSTWQSTPVSIDGQTDDWRKPLAFRDTKTNLNYSVSNDNNNLYICSWGAV